MKFLKAVKVDWIMSIYVVFLGLFFLFVVPPFQKPDEIIHFENTMALTNSLNWAIEARYQKFSKSLESLRIAHKYEQKSNYKDIFYKDSDRNVVTHPIGRDAESYISYLPVYAGAKIFESNDRPAVIFYAMRSFGFLWFLMYLFLSLKIVSKQ